MPKTNILAGGYNRKDGRHKVIDQFVAIKNCSLCQTRRGELATKRKHLALITQQLDDDLAATTQQHPRGHGTAAVSSTPRKKQRLEAAQTSVQAKITAIEADLANPSAEHDCRENCHDLESKGFKPRANVTMAERAPRNHKLIFDPVITDDDSATRKDMREQLQHVRCL